MALSPSLGDAGRQGSHFVSGGGQKVAVVSRHTRACPLVPPHDVLPTAATAATVSLRSATVSSRPSDEARDDVPLYHGPRVLLFHPPFATDSPPRVHFPTSGDHLPFCTRRTLWPSSRRRNAPPPLRSFLPLAGHCRHGHYHRLLLRLSSTSNGDDPTHPTVARYYHSVLLAIYRPLSTTLPPNGVYRCCLTAAIA